MNNVYPISALLSRKKSIKNQKNNIKPQVSNIIMKKPQKKNFTQFSNAVFFLPLSVQCKLIIINLHKYQNSPKGIFPTQKQIGFECSLSREYVGDCLKEIIEKSFILAEKVRGEGGKFDNTKYTINYPKIDQFLPVLKGEKKTKSSTNMNKSSVDHEVIDRTVANRTAGDLTNKKRTINNKTKINNKNADEPVPSAASENFRIFDDRKFNPFEMGLADRIGKMRNASYDNVEARLIMAEVSRKTNIPLPRLKPEVIKFFSQTNLILEEHEKTTDGLIQILSEWCVNKNGLIEEA